MASRLQRIAGALFDTPVPGESALKTVQDAMVAEVTPKPSVATDLPAVTGSEIASDALNHAGFTKAWDAVREDMTKFGGAKGGDYRPRTINMVLDEMAAKMPPEQHAEIDLLQRISAAVGDTRVQVWDDPGFGGGRAGQWVPAGHPTLRAAAQGAAAGTGKVQPNYDLITIHTNRPHEGPTIVHEAMHAGVARFINRNRGHSAVKQLGKLLEIARERARAIDGDEEVDKIIGKKDGYNKGLYGLTDVDEFMSEVVSNNSFRAWLASSESVATPGQTSWLTKGQTILDEITKLIGKMLGITKPETMHLLNRSMNVSKVLLDQAKRSNINKTAQRALADDVGVKNAAQNKKSLEDLRMAIGSKGGHVTVGTPSQSAEAVAENLDASLPENVTVDRLVQAYFGPRWEEVTDLEIRNTLHSGLRIDGHSPALDTMRTFSPDMKTVSHDWLKVHKGAAGTGYFKNMMKSTVDLYEEMGVEKITLSAGAEAGAYAWLRLGFIPDAPSTVAVGAIDRMKYDLQNAKVDPNDNAWVELAELEHFRQQNVHNRWVNQLIIEMAKQSPGLVRLLGDNPMKKVYAKSAVWDGSLDLTDKEQMAVFNEYVGRTGGAE